MVHLQWTKRDDPQIRERNLGNYESTIIREGNLEYAVEKGENSAQESYQEISGAPVEARSPLGYHVGAVTILFLNLSKMVGTGVFSTPASVLRGTGSVGLALIFWFLGFIIASAALSIYLEFASYFPNRSGSETVYLEQSFPRPRYFFPVTFAIQAVLLSFSASNAIVLSQYLFRISDRSPTPWEQKGVAVVGYTLAFLFVAFSTRWSFRISNAIGVVKLLTLVFVAVTGLVVLGGKVPGVPNPRANFENSFSGFDGVAISAYGCTNALYKIIFSYAGYENAFNVVNEVKVSLNSLKFFASLHQGSRGLIECAVSWHYPRGADGIWLRILNPVKSIRNSGGLALLTVAILYVLANIAYFAAVPRAELANSKQVVASLFFQHVFGSSGAVRGLNFLIALSAFGNLIAVLLGQSRLLRECGRQGTLPFTNFWISTRPFGTPLGPYTVKWALTLLMILAPPAGDAFNFVVDLAIYPSAFFNFLMAVGIYFVRQQRKKSKIPKPAKGYSFEAWNVAVVFTILVNIYMLVMPWYPPPGGPNGGDVSFWYATYAATGLGILFACGLYYVLWIYAIPKWRGYGVRHQKVVLEGGEVTHILVKVPLGQLSEWDQASPTVVEEKAVDDGGSVIKAAD